MNHNELSGRQASGWLAAALTAPLAQAASLCAWPAVTLVGGGTLAMGWWLSKYLTEPPRWILVLQRLWNCVVIGELLYWVGECWPDHEQGKAAPLILLLLACWAVCREKHKAARIGCTLLWPLGLLLGAVLLSGIPEIRIGNLKPTCYMPNAHLITVFLLPVFAAQKGERGKGKALLGLFLLGVAASVITMGVLSYGGKGQVYGGIYELSRSISLFGAVERIESLAAVAMTLGYFTTLTLLLETQDSEKSNGQWIYAVICGSLFLMGIRLDSRIIAIGSVVFWVIIPTLCSLKNIFQKEPKSA